MGSVCVLKYFCAQKKIFRSVYEDLAALDTAVVKLFY